MGYNVHIRREERKAMTAMFMTSRCRKQQPKRAYGKRAFVMGSWISGATGLTGSDSGHGKTGI